jgi:hypothetical protein
MDNMNDVNTMTKEINHLEIANKDIVIAKENERNIEQNIYIMKIII